MSNELLHPLKKIKLVNMDQISSSFSLNEKSLNLFSRQNAALGLDFFYYVDATELIQPGVETTAKLNKMRVLLYGLRGVGVETAKNLALQGVGAITLVDSSLSDIKDVGVNFFVSLNDIGVPRALVVAPKLRDLNPVCNVSVVEKLDDIAIKTHSALVVTQFLPLSELIRLDEICRHNKVSFFYAHTGGVSVDIFVDHGIDHIVNDFNGEKPVQKLITDVIFLSDMEVLLRYETPEGQQPVALSSGYYEVSEVCGINGLNGLVFPVSRNPLDPVKTVRIQFTRSTESGCFGKYVCGGMLTEKKVPTQYPMESLKNKLKCPGSAFSDPPTLVLTDLINIGSEIQQHVAFYATMQFADVNGRLPTVNSSEDAVAVLDMAKNLLERKDIDLDNFDLDDTFVTKYILHAGAELQPLAAFAGGVLAQEVVKCTGKFTPIPGFLHFSAFEALPHEVPVAADLLSRNSPLDELASVYGWSFVEKLGNLKYFMVGCGALGCEFVKNFALNGVCCGPTGKLVVTDADRIELSNLSRQFLFREHNVGHPKSKAAATMARKMNGNFQIEALELFVGPKSEDTFNDDFWEGLDGVCNALDNMEARLYVDQQCVKYEKSLLESGTMGTSGNIDTICPFKTRTYAEGGNAAEGGGVPMCTLRNFPHLTDHCIEWSRDQFELLFSKLGMNFEMYLANPREFESKIKDKASSEPGAAFFDIRSVISLAKLVANPTIGQAAQLAFDIFHYLFRDRILDLQTAFPVDFRIVDPVTKVDKGQFWSEKKRYPTVVVFNSDDESHRNFLLSATCLFGVMVGLLSPKKEGDVSWLKDYRDNNWITSIASSLSLPAYIQASVSSEGMETVTPGLDQLAVDVILNSLFTDLRNVTDSVVVKPTFELADFEKDDDLNFHISFITAAANLRCDNYSIKRTDFQACKVVAGKIIAAIATTTAAVCGLVMLELFKLVLQKDTDSYMNRAIGLASFTYTSFTAETPLKFATHTELIAPSVIENSSIDAWDESGKLKPEYFTKVVRRAYPENHSVWNKLEVDGKLTLKGFASWLSTKHNLKLKSWDFVYGHKVVENEENKKKERHGVSASVYPPKCVLDYSLLPSLEMSLAQATAVIMKTASAKPTQQYIVLWKECKSLGVVPAQPEVSTDVITETTTLIQILERMSLLAEEAELNKKITSRAIPQLNCRKFIVIPGNEAPQCIDLESGDDIEYMCALKVIL